MIAVSRTSVAQWMLEHLSSRTDCYARAAVASAGTPQKPHYSPSYCAGPASRLLPADEDAIARHLQGTEAVASYALNRDRCRFAVLDVDAHEISDLQAARQLVTGLHMSLQARGVPQQAMLVEFSGRRGFHLWLLFAELVPAHQARRLMATAAEGAGLAVRHAGHVIHPDFPCHVELFPHRDSVPADGFGYAIKLPLGLHPMSGQRSGFRHPGLGLELRDDALLRVRPLPCIELARIVQQCPEPATLGRRHGPHGSQRAQYLFRADAVTHGSPGPACFAQPLGISHRWSPRSVESDLAQRVLPVLKR